MLLCATYERTVTAWYYKKYRHYNFALKKINCSSFIFSFLSLSIYFLIELRWFLQNFVRKQSELGHYACCLLWVLFLRWPTFLGIMRKFSLTIRTSRSSFNQKKLMLLATNVSYNILFQRPAFRNNTSLKHNKQNDDHTHPIAAANLEVVVNLFSDSLYC